jgi:RNA polymerase sigma-70 factor (ECF subfamily)
MKSSRGFEPENRISERADTHRGVAKLHAEKWPLKSAPPALTESSSLDQLYRQYFDLTWRSLQHLGVPKEAIEDAVQDVWLAVHRQLPSFEGRSSARTWLFGIAINTARNYHRHLRRHPPDAPLGNDVPTSIPGPETLHAGNEALALVQRFIDALDEPQRILFVAHLLEDLPAAESAEILGVDVTTVYERVRRLRRALQRWFEEQQGGSP